METILTLIKERKNLDFSRDIIPTPRCVQSAYTTYLLERGKPKELDVEGKMKTFFFVLC